MQSKPEWVNLHLSLELHDIGFLCGICIRVRWQIEYFVTLLDMIDSDFLRRALLRQHDLVGERDYQIDSCRVDLTKWRSYGIVELFRNVIIHEKFKYEAIVNALCINAELLPVHVIRLVYKLYQLLLWMLLWAKPKLSEFFRVSLLLCICICLNLIKHLRVSVILVKGVAHGAIWKHTIHLLSVFYFFG